MIQKINLKKKFKNISYDLVDGHINFSALVNKFISDLKNKSFVYIIVNIKLLNSGYVSVGSRFPLNPKNKKDLSNYIDYLENKYLVLENRYKVDLALNVTFGFIHVREEFYSKTKNILMSTDEVTKALENVDFRNEIPANLPLNTFYNSWGNIITWLESDVQKISNLIFDLGNNINRYLIVKYIDKLNSLIEVKSNNSNLKLEIILDKIINPLTNDFIRQIGDKFYHIKNNKVYFIFERLLLKSEYITKSKTASKFILNILTLDIETYLNKDNKMDLYCLSFYDGNKSHSFYITNYNSTKDLMSDVLSRLLSREYSQKTVYIHNSSDFDLMFILKYLINFKKVKVEPIIKDGKFINLKIKYGPSNSYYLNFKDSFLLLPVGLSKLTKQFKVSTLKSFFPHKYVTKNNLNYIGSVPSYNNFDNISLDDYNNYCLNFNNNWALKKKQ
uniref:hypothetical protein n=1 Tax=Fuscoporia gilva TaxID=40471 RepID=UPI0023D89C39|nr:hypothetical protein P2X57_mgp46 [Fuscoporia gilva]WDD39619.1 hypothetical protein [Fuscoporia gilva]